MTPIMQTAGRPLAAGALAFAVMLALAGTAAAFRAPNGFVVQDLGNGQFEVQSRGGLSDANAWCAAGSYAQRVLGMNTGQIWRISPSPRPAGAGITFSTSSQGAASSTGMATIGGSGGSMSVPAAQSICNTLIQTRRNR